MYSIFLFFVFLYLLKSTAIFFITPIEYIYYTDQICEYTRKFINFINLLHI